MSERGRVDPALRRLRRRLTAWYVATSALILVVTGSLLFLQIARQVSRQVDGSLRAVVAEVRRATAVAESDGVAPRVAIAQSVDELSGFGHPLYLLDGDGRPIIPATVDATVAAAAREAAAKSFVDSELAPGDGSRWRVYGESVVLRDARRYTIITLSDLAELDNQYRRLLESFGGAALVALLLVGFGGARLARISAAPVELAMERMRRFMADAAHELRAPVAVLRARSEVTLQQGRDREEYEAALTTVAREGEMLARIVDDLLLLARAEAGDRPIQREAVYLDDLAAEAVMSASALAAEKGVGLDLGRCEETVVSADPLLMRQLVMIALDNAIKFTPATRRVTVETFAMDGQARLVVQDEGEGIPAAALPRVFDRFYRGDAARSRDGGAGLGLSIARWIADAHGAELSLSSDEGGGTRFELSMPRSPL